MKRRAWLFVLLLLAASGIAAPAPQATEGVVTVERGIDLHYIKVGSGAQTVILPASVIRTWASWSCCTRSIIRNTSSASCNSAQCR
jgi:hypothetical protein